MLSLVRAFAIVFSVSLDRPGFELGAELAEHGFDVEAGVPDLEVLHGGELAIVVR